MKEMETEAREHLNLALYNFNKMTVIDEEGIENNQVIANQRPIPMSNKLISAEQEFRSIKNMHNTASGFYPQRFGDRIPTRGEMQSRGGRATLITSAQGKRVGSRVDNSLGRIKQ